MTSYQKVVCRSMVISTPLFPWPWEPTFQVFRQVAFPQGWPTSWALPLRPRSSACCAAWAQVPFLSAWSPRLVWQVACAATWHCRERRRPEMCAGALALARGAWALGSALPGPAACLCVTDFCANLEHFVSKIRSASILWWTACRGGEGNTSMVLGSLGGKLQGGRGIWGGHPKAPMEKGTGRCWETLGLFLGLVQAQT